MTTKHSKYQLDSDFDFDSLLFRRRPKTIHGAAASLGVGQGPSASSTGPTATTSSTRSASAAPSWISSLQDPALKADFTSFSSAGSITEAEMAKALGDL